MADINSNPIFAPLSGESPQNLDLIELLFFAYRDFVSDPDQVLAESGFGRAHHRVLHFVHFTPGLTVAELLDILKITKQSLARVLRQLIDGGYIEQKTGQSDRRQRHLFTTATGEKLIEKLIALQARRIHDALSGLDASEHDVVRRFLLNVTDEGEHERILERRLRRVHAQTQ